MARSVPASSSAEATSLYPRALGSSTVGTLMTQQHISTYGNLPTTVRYRRQKREPDPSSRPVGKGAPDYVLKPLAYGRNEVVGVTILHDDFDVWATMYLTPAGREELQ